MKTETKTPEILYFEAKKMEKELTAARFIISRTLSALPVGYIPNHTPENLPEIVGGWAKEAAEECKRAEDAEKQLTAAQEHAERLRVALDSIKKLGLGPDQGTSAWQSQTAHEIATKALAAPSGQRFVRREVLEHLLKRVKSWFNSHPPMAFDDVISESSAELARTAPETIAQEGTG